MSDLLIKYYLILWLVFMLGCIGGALMGSGADSYWTPVFIAVAAASSLLTAGFIVRYALIGMNLI